MGFNKYQFIKELREDLADEFGCPHCAEEKGEKYEEPNQDDVYEYISQYCENQTIYYYKCWDICKELGATDFHIDELGIKARNISDLAYWSLRSYIDEVMGVYNPKPKEDESLCK